MAKKKETTETAVPLQRQSGANLTAIKADLAKEAKNFQQADALSDQATAIRATSREKVKSMGIHPKAFEDAIRYKKMDPDKRDNYDESYVIAREALGLGVQLSFLDDMQEALDDDPPAQPKPMFDDAESVGEKAAAARAVFEQAEQALGEQAIEENLPETLGTQH